MKYLISEIAIKNGKKGESWQDIVLPGYVEAYPDSDRILTLSGVAHTKTEVVTQGLNRGLCRREFHSSYYDVISWKLIGILQLQSP